MPEPHKKSLGEDALRMGLPKQQRMFSHFLQDCHVGYLLCLYVRTLAHKNETLLLLAEEKSAQSSSLLSNQRGLVVPAPEPYPFQEPVGTV